jgi:hypothetical protein
MKKVFLLFAWFLLSTGVILTLIAGVIFWHLVPGLERPVKTDPSVQISAALETDNQGQIKGAETILETADGRPQLVANFLRRYKSPLQPYDEWGQKIVAIADKYNIDFRLLPAIAMQESNLCKNIPEGTFNCLGFGIHERGTLAFESFEANFERAAKELKKYYIDKGLTTPEKIMTKYTPGSNGSWAESVNQWMAEMRYDDRSLGRELKTDASVLEFVEASPLASPNP